MEDTLQEFDKKRSRKELVILRQLDRELISKLKQALESIAVGEGHYGAQAFEYKTIARKALGNEI